MTLTPPLGAATGRLRAASPRKTEDLQEHQPHKSARHPHRAVAAARNFARRVRLGDRRLRARRLERLDATLTTTAAYLMGAGVVLILAYFLAGAVGAWMYGPAN
jgi:hypothetical protein